MNALETFFAVFKKFLSFVLAYSTALLGGYLWFEGKLKSAEVSAIKKVKEIRDADMKVLEKELSYIKDDLRVIKEILLHKNRR